MSTGPTSPTSNSISVPSRTCPSCLSLGEGWRRSRAVERRALPGGQGLSGAWRRRRGAGTAGRRRRFSAPRRRRQRTEPISRRPFAWSRRSGRLDIGQAAVVVKGRVLAVEAAEGTDAMLARCAELRRSGRAPPGSDRRAGQGAEARAGGPRRPADHRSGDGEKGGAPPGLPALRLPAGGCSSQSARPPSPRPTSSVCSCSARASRRQDA